MDNEKHIHYSAIQLSVDSRSTVKHNWGFFAQICEKDKEVN